jgi:ferredoxin
MKVRIDSNLCSGHGRCYTLAPDVFGSDDNGYSLLKVSDVPTELEDQARSGVANCPERAISIEE